MSSADDIELLTVNNRRLERELKEARLMLRDQFAMAALTGLLMHYGDVGHIIDQAGRTSIHFAAFDHAEQMLAQRGKGYGQSEKKAKDENAAAVVAQAFGLDVSNLDGGNA